MIDCPRLERKRNRRIMNKWRNRDKDRQVIDILFNEKEYEETSQMLRAMWIYRKDLLRPPQKKGVTSYTPGGPGGARAITDTHPWVHKN